MSFLNNILEFKKTWITQQKKEMPAVQLKELIAQTCSLDVPVFISTVRRYTSQRKNALIAELKRASPSMGDLPQHSDDVLNAYVKKNVPCLSILTESLYFKGSFDDLSLLKKKCHQPVLCKDFIIDSYQILWAKYCGADCILLIADILTPNELAALYHFACDLKLDVLIELFDIKHLEHILKLSPSMIGVNSRNLKTLSVDLENIIKIAQQIPNHIVIVAESGIQTYADIQKLNQYNIYAFLIGHSLIMSDNIVVKITSLFPEGF